MIMFKGLLLIGVFPIYLMAQDFRIVDFGKRIPPDNYQGDQAWVLGYQAFNFSPELTPFFKLLQKEYEVPIAIETGTYDGRTTTILARLFDKVHTIEILNSDIDHRLAYFPNVYCHFGDSSKVLPQLLSSCEKDRVFFYLDAHGGESDWPLLGELIAISNTHKDNCIIVIDDFKVPDRPDFGYDKYGEDECCYEYIQECLSKIFTECECCIVVPRLPSGRAKFVAFPKKWGTEKLYTEGYFEDDI
jgi:hypothetical protein